MTAQFSANPFTGALSNLDRGFDRARVSPRVEGAAAADGAPRTAAALHDTIAPWIERHARARFFLYVHTMDTHVSSRMNAAQPGTNAYQAAIAFADRQLQGLYARLEELGQASETLFIITADHGEAFGEHGRSGHGVSVYDEEVRVPLIVHGPGRVQAARVDDPVTLIDVMPTVLDYAGLAPVDRLQGQSLVPRSAGPRPSSRVVVTRFVYPEDLDGATTDRAEAHAIVDFPWKLIAVDRSTTARTLELYRLDRDARERENLAVREPERARRLEAALDAFLREQATARSRIVLRHQIRQDAPRTAPSRDVLEHLRSLGYVR